MNEVFNTIYETRSMTVIERLAQEAIEDGATGMDLKYLNAILEEDDLDKIYISALLGAGRIDEAVALQVEVDAFTIRKAERALKVKA